MIDLQLKFSTYSRSVCNLAEISDDLSQSVRNFNIIERPNHPCTTFHNLQKTFKEQIRKRWEAQFNDDVLELFTHWKRQVDTQHKLIDAYELERSHCYEVKSQLTERCEARQRYVDKNKAIPPILEEELKRYKDSYDKIFIDLSNARTSLDANQKRLAGQDRFLFFDKLFTALVQMQVSFEEELHLVTKKYASLIIEIKSIQNETAVKHQLVNSGAESPTSEELDLNDLLFSPNASSPTSMDNYYTDEQSYNNTVISNEKQEFIHSLNSFLIDTFNEANEDLATDAAKAAFGLLDSTATNKSKEKQAKFKDLIYQVYAEDDSNALQYKSEFSKAFESKTIPEVNIEENPEDQIEFDPLHVSQISSFQTPTKNKKDNASTLASPELGLSTFHDGSHDTSQDSSTFSPLPSLTRQSSAFAPGSATKRKERLSFGFSALLNSSTGHIGAEPSSSAFASTTFSPSNRKSSQFNSPFASPRQSLKNSENKDASDTASSKNDSKDKEALNDSLNIIFEVDDNIKQHFTRYLEDDIPVSIKQQQEQQSKSLLSKFNDEAEDKPKLTNTFFTDSKDREAYQVETEQDDAFLTRTAKWLDDVHSAPLIDIAMSITTPKCDMRRMDLFQWSCDTRSLTKSGISMDAAFTEFQNGNLPPLNHIRTLLSTIQTVLWADNGLHHFPLSLLETEEYLLVFCKKTFHILLPYAEKAIDKSYTPPSDTNTFTDDEILKALVSVTVLRILRSSLREYLSHSSQLYYDDLLDKLDHNVSFSGSRSISRAEAFAVDLPDLPPASYHTN